MIKLFNENLENMNFDNLDLKKNVYLFFRLIFCYFHLIFWKIIGIIFFSYMVLKARGVYCLHPYVFKSAIMFYENLYKECGNEN
jgi:hypothetical protein